MTDATSDSRVPTSYATAQAELEDILAELQAPDAPLDVLAARVGRARVLLAWCRNELRTTEREVDALLEDTEA